MGGRTWTWLAALVASALASGAWAQAAPARCTVGAFVTSIHDIEVAKGTFDADLWIWTVCPDLSREPLKTMEVNNASAVSTSLHSAQRRGDVYWSQHKLTGTFRQRFDLRNFPFDRHRLVIQLEEGVEDASTFRYAPDAANSRYNPAIALSGWRLGSFSAAGRETVYPTNFGDPALPPASEASYTRLDLEVELARAELGTFLRLSIPAYVAAALALISFLMHIHQGSILNPRVPILAGAVFTTVLNLNSVNTAVGGAHGVTLLSALHFLTLTLILLATMAAVGWGYLLARGWSERRVARLDHACFLASGAAYLAANVVLVAWAIEQG